MDAVFRGQVRHLYEVERLSMRQIAQKLGVSKKRVFRVIRDERITKPAFQSIVKPYERLIDQWYEEFPFLKGSEVYGRLKAHGFKGSYATVSLYTQKYRQKKRQPYHELTFLAGEAAQIDWIEARLGWGVTYGFSTILAYSRYLLCGFIPARAWSSFWRAISRPSRRWQGWPITIGMITSRPW